MTRRTCIGAMLTAAGAARVEAADKARPIALHLDLTVDPAKEAEMLRFFQTQFRPAAAKQPGYMDLRMEKLTATLRGPAPPLASNFRFVLLFTSEELRQKWVDTDTHKKLWPVIEGSLTTKEFTRILYEVY